MLKRILSSVPIVLITGMIVRLATVGFIDFSTFNWSKPRPDLLMEYGVIARNLAKGLGYSYTWYSSSGVPFTLPSAYMPPGLVFLEYGVIAIFGYSIAAALVIFLLQAVMAVACIWFAGKIAEALFSSKTIAGTARWIVALYPPFIYSVMSFGITTSVMFTSFALLFCALKLVRTIQEKKPTLLTSVLFGASCGLLMLLRGEGPLIVLATFMVLAIKLRPTVQRSVSPIAVAAVTALVIIAPWTIRNYIVFDRFIPVSSNGSFNFWRGNNEITSGSPLMEAGDPLWSSDELWLKAESELGRGVDFEDRFSSIYQEAAFAWIEDHPLTAAALAIKKGVIFWTFDVRNKIGGWGYAILHTIALGITIFGSVRLIKERKRFTTLSSIGFSLIITWAALATITAMAFLPLVRFQIVTMAMLAPIAAYGLTELFGQATRQKK